MVGLDYAQFDGGFRLRPGLFNMLLKIYAEPNRVIFRLADRFYLKNTKGRWRIL